MSDDAPERSHDFWDAGFVGAHSEAFPHSIGQATAMLHAHSRSCAADRDGARCWVPTTVSYDGRPLCLAHALMEESLAAGRTDEALGPAPAPNRVPPWEEDG